MIFAENGPLNYFSIIGIVVTGVFAFLTLWAKLKFDASKLLLENKVQALEQHQAVAEKHQADCDKALADSREKIELLRDRAEKSDNAQAGMRAELKAAQARIADLQDQNRDRPGRKRL